MWASKEPFLAKSPYAWWAGVETRVRLGRRSAEGAVTTQTVTVCTVFFHMPGTSHWKLQDSVQPLERIVRESAWDSRDNLV